MVKDSFRDGVDQGLFNFFRYGRGNLIESQVSFNDILSEMRKMPGAEKRMIFFFVLVLHTYIPSYSDEVISIALRNYVIANCFSLDKNYFQGNRFYTDRLHAIFGGLEKNFPRYTPTELPPEKAATELRDALKEITPDLMRKYSESAMGCHAFRLMCETRIFNIFKEKLGIAQPNQIEYMLFGDTVFADRLGNIMVRAFVAIENFLASTEK